MPLTLRTNLITHDFKHNAILGCSANLNPALRKHFQGFTLKSQVIRTKREEESSNEPIFSSKRKILGQQIHENTLNRSLKCSQ